MRKLFRQEAIEAQREKLLGEVSVARPVPGDRRVSAVRLTPRGREAFLAMADAHEQWVIAMMAGVGERERGELAALLARLKQSVAEHGVERGR